LNADLLHWWHAAGNMAALFVTHSVAEAVFLSQRVLVMAARPGRVVAELAIDAPYPRPADFRHSLAFNDHCRQLGEALAAAHGAAPRTA
jgi:NitT/TauT family transport system ATP-binding protein